MSVKRLSTTTAARQAVVLAPDEVKVVAKPWGQELWVAHTDRYAGKLLILKQSRRLSLQFHEIQARSPIR